MPIPVLRTLINAPIFSSLHIRVGQHDLYVDISRAKYFSSLRLCVGQHNLSKNATNEFKLFIPTLMRRSTQNHGYWYRLGRLFIPTLMRRSTKRNYIKPQKPCFSSLRLCVGQHESTASDNYGRHFSSLRLCVGQLKRRSHYRSRSHFSSLRLCVGQHGYFATAERARLLFIPTLMRRST